ncbi:MAG TPA: phosphoribosyltransferase family protein [Candidatus Nanopelagicales bacterium]|nr:phosphoribosyltransferase family protein [Candidatus Nanopelagicales bacterium]
MFTDRSDAGRRLAQSLTRYSEEDPLVLALPRGGVPLGREVAAALNAPLDVVNVRKLGAPSNPEFAFGAVGEGGAVVVDEPTMSALGISPRIRDQLIAQANAEIQSRVTAFRAGRDLVDVTERTVLVVDDGLATGSTAAAAVMVLRHLGAARIIFAVPTGSRSAVERLRQLCDEVVCLEIPDDFGSVGAQYESFPQVTESEVLTALGR